MRFVYPHYSDATTQTDDGVLDAYGQRKRILRPLGCESSSKPDHPGTSRYGPRTSCTGCVPTSWQ